MTILLFMLHLVIYIITFLHLLPPVCTSSTCLFKLSGHGRNRCLLSIIKTFRVNMLKESLKSSSHYTIIPLQHTCLPGLSTKTNPSINNTYYRAICSYGQIIRRQRRDGHVLHVINYCFKLQDIVLTCMLFFIMAHLLHIQILGVREKQVPMANLETPDNFTCIALVYRTK